MLLLFFFNPKGKDKGTVVERYPVSSTCRVGVELYLI